MTTRANRLLILAYRAHQRGETEIAGRMAALAFQSPDAESIVQAVQNAPEEPQTDVEKAEAILRKAEASTKGNIFTEDGTAALLSIAEKLHDSGMPKVAKSIARIAQ